MTVFPYKCQPRAIANNKWSGVSLCRVNDLGVMEYERACALQRQCVDSVLQGGPQVLLLCEHPAVLTLGRMADERHILCSRETVIQKGAAICPIDRGGDVTLHAPGQLVVYPILDLANFGKDLRSYLHQLEQVAIDLLGDFDIVAGRLSGQTGVWAGTKKIASIGIGVRKWVSFHGLAVNVTTDLSLFSMIKPCGLDVRMTSMSQVKQKTVSMDDVKERLVESFCRNFQCSALRTGQ